MINKKYSQSSFKESKKKSKKSAKKLSKQLETEIQSLFDKLVAKELKKIVADLNKAGHDLKLDYEPEPGDIAYIDRSSGSAKLRVSVDTIICVGYARAPRNRAIFSSI